MAVVANSSDPNAAIADFVQVVMGVPRPDPRAPALQGSLQRHYASALDANATSSDALRSAFIAACTAGTAIGRGL